MPRRKSDRLLEAVEQVNAYADDLLRRYPELTITRHVASTLFSSPLFSFPLRENLLRNALCGMYTAEGLAHNNTVKGESFLKVYVIADYDRGLCRNKGKKGEYEERQGAVKAGPAYRYGPSYHGRQQVPFIKVWHWSQLVEKYQAELDGFRQRVDVLAGRVKVKAEASDVKPLPAAAFKLLSPDMQTYTVEPGAKVFSDQDYALSAIAPELKGLTGIRFSYKKSTTGQDVVVEIENEKPVKVLIGYFDGPGSGWLKVPNLEHVAHADDRGGHETKLFGAVVIQNSKALTEAALPRVNVHAFRYEVGRNKVEMIGKGAYVILGVIPAEVEIPCREVGFGGGGK